MINGIKNNASNIFDSIKHIDDNGNEYWLARELQKVLNYQRWDKFSDVINKAKSACECSKNIIENHFSQVGNMVLIGSSAKRKIMDYQLSHYAC